MENSPLRQLPPELCNYIYELALTRDRPLVMFSCSGNPRQYPVSRQEYPLSLVRTCTVFHNDATQLFYAVNAFQFKLNTFPHDRADLEGAQLLASFLDMIGRTNTCALRSIVIDVGTIWHDQCSRTHRRLLRSLCDGLHGGRFRDLQACDIRVRTELQYQIWRSGIVGFTFELDMRNLGASLDRNGRQIREKKVRAAQLDGYDQQEERIMLSLQQLFEGLMREVGSYSSSELAS
ncbi:hypothetical protein LTR36_003146 [Oleoguttula mirabilis]|uniref:Uncharacterized protein n=1 Tax=Oleoguttula mirabilis TaxID=1507867 RepID=A0AAV9JX45_9PEZI|nr:hypothetical protein LTR36_003146 [Oleoguttula mirabilis]